MDYTETNKLIAEFMKVPKGKHFHYDIEPFDVTEYRDVEDLKYDISWDWLMPVKDKVIPLTDDLPSKYYDMIVNGLITGDIHQVYNSCVEVIKLTIKK
tara:strand:+ start:3148 stop:3441 length:294 start_codon:yes stop_codon:yes gene_type:complete